MSGTSSSSAQVTNVAPLYDERFHIRYLFSRLWIPLLLLVGTVFFAGAIWSAGQTTDVAVEPDPQQEHVDGALAEAIGKFFQTIADAIGTVLDKLIAALIPSTDISVSFGWVLWVWGIVLLWLFARAWFSWFMTRVVVNIEGITIKTPKSFFFALGSEGPWFVPAGQLLNAKPKSTIIDNTLFLKTSEKVTIFFIDASGGDDNMAVEHARHGDKLVKAINHLGLQNASRPIPGR